MMSDEPEGYQTYLLRLWYVQVQGKTQWRASIESPHTGERHLFANLEQLFAFLRERCKSEGPGMLEVEGEIGRNADSQIGETEKG
jgi:hypothetical protein